LTTSREVIIEEVPEMEAHSPVEFRKEMLTEGSAERSSVLPDSVFVWKIRSTPPDSYLPTSMSCEQRERNDFGLRVEWNENGDVPVRQQPCIETPIIL
jgi:hypothetical protein